jgi:hypothetical protein
VPSLCGSGNDHVGNRPLGGEETARYNRDGRRGQYAGIAFCVSFRVLFCALFCGPRPEQTPARALSARPEVIIGSGPTNRRHRRTRTTRPAASAYNGYTNQAGSSDPALVAVHHPTLGRRHISPYQTNTRVVASTGRLLPYPIYESDPSTYIVQRACHLWLSAASCPALPIRRTQNRSIPIAARVPHRETPGQTDSRSAPSLFACARRSIALES